MLARRLKKLPVQDGDDRRPAIRQTRPIHVPRISHTRDRGEAAADSECHDVAGLVRIRVQIYSAGVPADEMHLQSFI